MCGQLISGTHAGLSLILDLRYSLEGLLPHSPMGDSSPVVAICQIKSGACQCRQGWLGMDTSSCWQHREQNYITLSY